MSPLEGVYFFTHGLVKVMNHLPYHGLVGQGAQQALKILEDPEKPWIFFVPGKYPGIS